jgi:hypothetical protein
MRRIEILPYSPSVLPGPSAGLLFSGRNMHKKQPEHDQGPDLQLPNRPRDVKTRVQKVPSVTGPEASFRKARVEEARSEVDSGEFDMHG